jgi:hypothetical protein
MATPDDETRQIIRRNWFYALGEIADIELQRRTWLDLTNTDNPHWSYVEFIESYPRDDELLDGLEKGYLSPQEADIFADFRRIKAAYKPPSGKNWDHAAILNDPAWHRVVQAAQRAVQDLARLPQP